MADLEAEQSMVFFAHSAPDLEDWEPLSEHLELVAERAEVYAQAFDAGVEARVAGVLHDAGKASEIFTRRLRGELSGLDHWSPGAALALRRYRENGIAVALAIQGHHLGLASASKQAIACLHDLDVSEDRTLTSQNPEELLAHLEAEGLTVPRLERSLFDQAAPHADALLDVRMLFSALVDADFLETEAHFDRDERGERQYRPEAPSLQAPKALRVLEAHLTELAERNRGQSSKEVHELRVDLLRACIEGAEERQGTFTLSAPTGSGKTLAMLAFALRHAQIHEMRRIVYVVPYLSIIEQTAHVYRELLEPVFGSGYVLEHHSLAGTRGNPPRSDEQAREPAETLRRRQAENWDAPLVLTTSVQLLDSLFAHRPGPCRKLHRLARSVVLFDEVQTLPRPLAVATLATLSRLSARYGASVVFCTATQPAFESLDGEIRRWSISGWQPHRLLPNEAALFRRLNRVTVEPRVSDWSPAARIPWEELADELSASRQVLCIVNLKRHARDLAERLKGRGEGVFHLSTAMCAAHRRSVLDRVKRRLRDGEPCRLVSTQCVEAGVDVDFPVVYRAFGPLDAIAQAAGRCNRNGTMPERGRLVVFLPDEPAESAYPDGDYRQAADVTREVLQSSGEQWDLRDQRLFDAWYRRLYDLSGLGRGERRRERELQDAMKARDFERTAHSYRIIPEDSIQIVVPWDERWFEKLREASEDSPYVTRKWMRDAQLHSVSVYRSRLDEYRAILLPAPLGARSPEQQSDDWFFLNAPDPRELYDETYGLGESRAVIVF